MPLKMDDFKKKEILSKVITNFKIYHSFADISKKCESAGYCEVLFDTFLAIFQTEANYITKR